MKSRLIFFWFLLLAESPQLCADDKVNAWTVGFSGARRQWKTDGDHHFDGSYGMFQIGFGKILQRLSYSGSFDIVMGPFDKIRREQVKTDFNGTGFSLKAQFAPWWSGFRGGNGTMFINTGVSYSDTVGRQTTPATPINESEKLSRLVVKISDFSGSVGLGYGNFLAARANENTPSALLTRIEGWTLAVDYGFPIKATHTTRYEIESNKNDSTDIESENTSPTERGRILGFSVIFSATAHLGF